MTTGQWLGRWLACRTSPASSTVRGYAAHVRLYLQPHLGPILLGELTTAQVQAMFTAIIRQHQATGHPVTPATLARIRATSLDHIRRDRILQEALATGADPLHLSLVFNIDHTNAMAYANAARTLLGPSSTSAGGKAQRSHLR